MFRSIAPVTLALIVANVIAFLLQMVVGDPLFIGFALWPLHAALDVPPFRVWQIITYAFLHGGFTHLALNMFALYMFGSDIERYFGSKRYLAYYFACLIGAALVQLAAVTIGGGEAAPTVGASGAVMGLLLAFGMVYPDRRVIFLLLPIPIPAWLFVILYGLVELGSGVFSIQPGVAHFAHLGGMATGFVMMMVWRFRERGAGKEVDR
jgi:membrane associated rhomboid family serine protease